jgi:hypothetical protein
MRRDEFQRRAKRWLSTYKRDVLGVEEDGIWLRNRKRYPHILPQEKYQLNILLSFRDEFWKWFPSQRIQLHSDFHHLNSSQAVCFNLFFPMLTGDGQGLAALLSAMDVVGLPKAGASFEYEPYPDEGTCIDFSVPLQSGARINFEIKYTESEFGSAKADEAHLEKFNRTYQSRLAGRFEESFCCAARFLEHYQIARNIWQLDEAAGDTAVFLFPKANTCLRREEETIRTCAVEPFRSRIRILYLEDLIVGLHRRLEPSDPARRQHLEEFRLKYFPDSTSARCDTAN